MVFLIAICWLVGLVASIVIVIKAFKVSPLWGLAVLFVPFAGLVFIVKYWHYTQFPALVLICVVLFGTLVAWMSAGTTVETGSLVANGGQAISVDEKAAVKPTNSNVTESAAERSQRQAKIEGDARDIPLRDNARREVRENADGYPVVVTTLGAEEELSPELQALDTEQILARLGELGERRIRVTTRDGVVSEGYVRREDSWLVVERRGQSGYFERKVALEDLESLEILR